MQTLALRPLSPIPLSPMPMSPMPMTPIHPARAGERERPSSAERNQGLIADEKGRLSTISSSDSIIEAAQQGSAFAFEQLIEQYRAAAHRLAQQILRTEEAAADAVQEALLKAYQAMTRFEEGNFRSWLLRIVANTCYDHLRRQKRRKAISLDELIEEAGFEFESTFETTLAPAVESPEKMFIQQETMTLLLQAIDELPAWHRTVVLLIDVHGYDYAEAAVMLNLPLGTVKSRLSRARVTLRDRLYRLQIKS